MIIIVFTTSGNTILVLLLLSSSLMAISGVFRVQTPTPTYNNALSLSTELCSRGRNIMLIMQPI